MFTVLLLLALAPASAQKSSLSKQLAPAMKALDTCMEDALSRFVESAQETASAIVNAAYGACRHRSLAFLEAAAVALGSRAKAGTVAELETARRPIYEGWVFTLRAQAPAPIRGLWHCEQMYFFVSRESYGAASGSGEFTDIRIARVERNGVDYLVVLSDGYRVSLLNLTGNGLTWHSPISGDTFECSRVATEQEIMQRGAREKDRPSGTRPQNFAR